jgi:hypothetical protein
MPKTFSTGARTTAGSITLPVISLYSGASGGGNVMKITVCNTTATPVALKLVELSSTGTPGAGLSETFWGYGGATASCTAFNTHSVAPTVAADLGHNVMLQGVIGDRFTWDFSDFNSKGISTGGPGTGNGIGVIVAIGTGQALDATIVWQEQD